MWAVVAGVIGSRLYYVVTDKSRAVAATRQALSRSGTAASASPAGCWSASLVGDVAGQAPRPLGARRARPRPPRRCRWRRRSAGWGNWWNQELFGRPTTLPWGLRIDDEHLTRTAWPTPPGTLFHPTFLYESLWNLALCGVLLLDRQPLQAAARPADGGVRRSATSLGRFWVEGLRIDNANAGGGLRLNQWVALVVGRAGRAAILVVDWWSHRHDPPNPIPSTSRCPPPSPPRSNDRKRGFRAGSNGPSGDRTGHRGDDRTGCPRRLQAVVDAAAPFRGSLDADRLLPDRRHPHPTALGARRWRRDHHRPAARSRRATTTASTTSTRCRRASARSSASTDAATWSPSGGWSTCASTCRSSPTPVG